MPTITVEEAQAKLPELIDGLARGEEVELTREGWVGSWPGSWVSDLGAGDVPVQGWLKAC